MIQQRVADPTLTNIKGIWVSPMRDIAHALPYILSQVVELTRLDKEYAARKDEFEKYFHHIADFIRDCVGPTSPDNIQEISMKHSIVQFDNEVQEVVGKWFLRALLSFYWKGIREALHPGEKALGVAELIKGLEVADG